MENDQIKTPENIEEVKLDKIKHPKRKYALIHGYNGHKYHGNQK